VAARVCSNSRVLDVGGHTVDLQLHPITDAHALVFVPILLFKNTCTCNEVPAVGYSLLFISTYLLRRPTVWCIAETPRSWDDAYRFDLADSALRESLARTTSLAGRTPPRRLISPCDIESLLSRYWRFRFSFSLGTFGLPLHLVSII